MRTLETYTVTRLPAFVPVTSTSPAAYWECSQCARRFDISTITDLVLFIRDHRCDETSNEEMNR